MTTPHRSSGPLDIPDWLFNRSSRAAFLSRISVGILAAAGAPLHAAETAPAAETASPYLGKGHNLSRGRRWDVITIGNLSRNRYWGEDDARGVRPAICTCTVIQGGDFRLMLSQHSLRFDCDGLSVVIAGDAVPMRDFWRERRGYYNGADLVLSAKTMDQIANLADLVVPGHDNYFLNLKKP